MLHDVIGWNVQNLVNANGMGSEGKLSDSNGFTFESECVNGNNGNCE